MTTQNQRKTNRDASFKLWLSADRCLEILTGLEHGWLTCQRCQPYQMLLGKSDLSVRMTAMCCVKLNTIWFGDSKGSIHSFKCVSLKCFVHHSIFVHKKLKGILSSFLTVNQIVAARSAMS